MTDLPKLPILCIEPRDCGTDGVLCIPCRNKAVILAHAAALQALIREEARLGLHSSRIEMACLKRARDAVLKLAGLKEGKNK